MLSYLYVHGVNEIRSLDVNLPKPTMTEYPVYNDTGSVFMGMYDVASFATWQTTPSSDLSLSAVHQSVAASESQAGRDQLVRERCQQRLSTA